MTRDFIIHDIHFMIGNNTPRKNEYERGQNYRLYVRDVDYGYMPTKHTFCTIREGVEFINNNYWLFK